MVTNSIHFWTLIVITLNNNYINNYYVYIIVELLNENSKFYIRIVTTMSSVVFSVGIARNKLQTQGKKSIERQLEKKSIMNRDDQNLNKSL